MTYVPGLAKKEATTPKETTFVQRLSNRGMTGRGVFQLNPAVINPWSIFE